MAVDGRTRRRRLHRFDDGAFLGSGEISSRGWVSCKSEGIKRLALLQKILIEDVRVI